MPARPNDAGMLAWNREADYFQQMVRDQFNTLYREGAENGRVMCLHGRECRRAPHRGACRRWVGRYCAGAARRRLGDHIAEYYLANYSDQVMAWIAEGKNRLPG
jgi:hypothetical protein